MSIKMMSKMVKNIKPKSTSKDSNLEKQNPVTKGDLTIKEEQSAVKADVQDQKQTLQIISVIIAKKEMYYSNYRMIVFT